MARKKKAPKALAPRGDAAGMAAIRIWAMQLETAMIQRYVGNAPTLEQIRKISSEALTKVNRIKPKLMSDCPGWDHMPECQCVPSI
jgi:hypothetical protein